MKRHLIIDEYLNAGSRFKFKFLNISGLISYGLFLRSLVSLGMPSGQR